MVKGERRLFFKVYLILITVFLILSVFGNFMLYKNYIRIYNSIHGLASDTGSISFYVECGVNQTCTPSTPSSGGGGGGGGYTPPVNETNESVGDSSVGLSPPIVFLLDPDELNVDVVEGERKKLEVSIFSVHDENLVVNIGGAYLDNLKLEENQIILAPGERRTVSVEIGPYDFGVYVGNIIFAGGGVVKELPVLINVVSKNAFFEADIDVPESYQNIKVGSDLQAFISMVSKFGSYTGNIDFEFFIKDFRGNTFSPENESIYVDESIYFVKKFISSEIPAGEYAVAFKAVYDGGFVSASERFTISEPKDQRFLYLILIIFALILIVTYNISKEIRESKRRRLLKKLRFDNFVFWLRDKFDIKN